MGGEIGHILGEISEDENSINRPMLNTVAVGVGGWRETVSWNVRSYSKG